MNTAAALPHHPAGFELRFTSLLKDMRSPSPAMPPGTSISMA